MNSLGKIMFILKLLPFFLTVWLREKRGNFKISIFFTQESPSLYYLRSNDPLKSMIYKIQSIIVSINNEKSFKTGIYNVRYINIKLLDEKLSRIKKTQTSLKRREFKCNLIFSQHLNASSFFV